MIALDMAASILYKAHFKSNAIYFANGKLVTGSLSLRNTKSKNST